MLEKRRGDGLEQRPGPDQHRPDPGLLSDYARESLRLTLVTLLGITRGVGPDMHEPDQWDIEADVVGRHLGNSSGNSITEHAIMNGFQEMVLVVRRRTKDGTETERFNVADLIALARMAVVS